MTSIKELTLEIVKFRDERKWKKYHTPKNLSLSIIIELAELFELYQWETNKEISTKLSQIRPQLAEELADVTIYLFLLAHELGIDLETAIPEKIKKNGKKYPL